MSATAADGFFLMKFHLRWGGGCGVIWGGLSHPSPSLVTSLEMLREIALRYWHNFAISFVRISHRM